MNVTVIRIKAYGIPENLRIVFVFSIGIAEATVLALLDTDDSDLSFRLSFVNYKKILMVILKAPEQVLGPLVVNFRRLLTNAGAVALPYSVMKAGAATVIQS